MVNHRKALPQLGEKMFLTDGGIETTLIFHEGLELPDFAAFDLLKRPGGAEALRRYFDAYAAIAARHGAGLILESATWRASQDWGNRLGYAPDELSAINRQAIELLVAVRAAMPGQAGPVVISGCVGPRGDGYVPGQTMSAREAETYHHRQIATFADTDADIVTAITMNYAEEAIGVAAAARGAGVPVAISFTVETDGHLPTGQPLREAIAQVDDATSGYPAYYMINCAHPTHFEHILAEDDAWMGRLRGLRANASRQSHAELNEALELDTGDPDELGTQYASLKRRLPQLTVLGGCCGTDQRHVEKIAEACMPLFQSAR